MNQTIQAFNYPANLIKEYEYWVVLLRPEQVTIGSMVLAAKSDVTNLGLLSQEAWAEFAAVCGETEQLLRDCFGAEKFNYLALMMKDPNVHFHLIPRYSSPITVNGVDFLDEDWPSKTEMRNITVGEEEFAEVQRRLVDATHQ